MDGETPRGGIGRAMPRLCIASRGNKKKLRFTNFYNYEHHQEQQHTRFTALIPGQHSDPVPDSSKKSINYRY